MMSFTSPPWRSASTSNALPCCRALRAAACSANICASSTTTTISSSSSSFAPLSRISPETLPSAPPTTSAATSVFSIVRTFDLILGGAARAVIGRLRSIPPSAPSFPDPVYVPSGIGPSPSPPPPIGTGGTCVRAGFSGRPASVFSGSGGGRLVGFSGGAAAGASDSPGFFRDPPAALGREGFSGGWSAAACAGFSGEWCACCCGGGTSSSSLGFGAGLGLGLGAAGSLAGSFAAAGSFAGSFFGGAGFAAGAGAVSPESTRATASALGIVAAWASCCRKMFVWSGSWPATIFRGFTCTFSPEVSCTHTIAFLRNATLVSRSFSAPSISLWS
eukprot:comp21147_c0_seq1/m.44803 comp21147_c0_seq1/g.44803  ORF comp21147_c0_seq1/g.44803 comp21147_c0_seq1/m.44803 type:complete len:332 (-) comp21147_c0_seq1:191-1186(-)